MDLSEIFEPQHLHWFDFSYTSDFDTLMELPGALQEGIKKSVAVFNHQVDAAVEAMGDEEKYEYLDFVSVRHWELSTEYPLLMRRALLMVTYSKAEYSMHRLCEAAHLDGKCSVPNPNGVYLGDSESYIKNELAIADPSLEPDWQYLNSVRLIRNKFVHEDGHLGADPNSDRIRQFAGLEPDLEIEIDELGFLTLGSRTVESIARRCKSFTGVLLQKIKAQ